MPLPLLNSRWGSQPIGLHTAFPLASRPVPIFLQTHASLSLPHSLSFGQPRRGHSSLRIRSRAFCLLSRAHKGALVWALILPYALLKGIQIFAFSSRKMWAVMTGHPWKTVKLLVGETYVAQDAVKNWWC